MKRTSFFVILLVLISCAPCFAYSWSSYGGHEYSLTQSYSNWMGAEAEAVTQGGHLVTINGADELSFLLGAYQNILPKSDFTDPGGYSFFWIGLYNTTGDLPDLNDWKWADNDASTYWQEIAFNAWGWHFPYSSGGGIHAYLHTAGHAIPGTINNDATWDRYGNVLGVIEKSDSPVPEPSTMLLLGFGLVGLAGVARKKIKR